MATWKKVIVSGSNISQLNNDAGYLTSVTAQNSFVTMSVNGTPVIADSAVDTLTFISSSGAGLNIVGDAGADSITFNLTGIPGSSLNTTSVANAISGSIYSGVSGDILIAANGAATIQTNSVALGTDTTGNYVASVANGTGITAIAAAGEGSAVTVSVSGASTLNTNAVTKWTGTAFANSTITDDGSTVTITGNLTVNGTTITVSTENLTVSDKFILLASGSTSNVDGGIIVSNAAANTGTAFYYDGNDQRWAVTPSVASNSTSATVNSYVVTVSGSSANPSGNPLYGAADPSRIGAMYVNTSDQSIWIWS
jgi:hypothetical protein